MDAPDAARMLFGVLPIEDNARAMLGAAILGWLEKRHKEPIPVSRQPAATANPGGKRGF